MNERKQKSWYKVVDRSSVPDELRLAGEKMLEFVKTDLQLPELKLAWCINDTAENERSDTERRFDGFAEKGVYDPTPYRTDEALNCPALTDLYILVDGATEHSGVRDIAFRAKIFQKWLSPEWHRGNWKNGDPAFDPEAYAEYAATCYPLEDPNVTDAKA